MKIQSILPVLLIMLLAAGCGGTQVDTIRVGGIFDLTGPTSDVSIQYADGVRDYVQYINEQGGINGRPVELIAEDYAYEIPRAQSLYDRLVRTDRVLVILGWGTGDTEALREQVAKDQVPFMSASYAESLTVVQDAPYNFLVGVTYSDQMRIALRYIDETWTDTSRRPRVAFIYNDSPFGTSPLEAGRQYAAARGITVVSELVVPLTAQDASAQMQELAQTDADYAIIQETAGATATILRDAQRLELRTRFIGLNWAADEKVVALAGQAAEGFLGTIPFVFLAEKTTGTDEILAYAAKVGKDPATLTNRYVAGWATTQVMLEGVRRAGDDLTGPAIRRSLESLADYDPQGLAAPIAFGATSHKGARALRIYQVQDGVWVPVTGYIEAVAP